MPLSSVRALRVLFALALFVSACAESPSSSDEYDSEALVDPAASCGFQVTTGTRAVWNGGFEGWVRLTNTSAVGARSFRLLVDVGDAQVVSFWNATFTQQEPGTYFADEPSWLSTRAIRPGETFQLGFVASGPFQGIQSFVLAVQGAACDVNPPTVSLSASQSMFTEAGQLTLTASASDDAAVRRVVFYRNGTPIATDETAPYEATVAVSEAENGRAVFTARAFDPSGNESTSNSIVVLVAIGTRFVGNVLSGVTADPQFANYWNQVTPENGGKWGVAEPTRDVMNWAELDAAYAYARANGFPFKLHTLVWGQQQPSWVSALSASEQRAEIEEWFALLAQRYPDAEMIDVVNEPINSPPAYREALGGAGATGWDWVITSFQLARTYFPNSQLLLNEYNVLFRAENTQNYRSLVELLQSRGLIDGIGLQAHFLERAEVAVVEMNLANLATTGLPIYISEFDINFADDARHAIRFAELFQVFWENESVIGVTLWGYRQGTTWQPNAYLLRTDGTERPALSWLVCYLDGNEECPLPTYVPPARVGTAGGLRIEAEDYDDAEGLSAAGSVIAYTDAGDWVRYDRVVLESSYTRLSIRYAKGNETAGRLTVHLGSLDSPAVATVTVPSTGSWSTFSTLEIPWTPTAGEQTVYVRFNDVGGFANIDRFDFGRPARTGTSARLDIEAESYDASTGVDNYGTIIGGTDAGDYVLYASVVIDPAYNLFEARYGRGASGGGNVEVHLDSLTGPVVASFGTVNTGGWNTFIDTQAAFSGPAGTHDLYVVFTGNYMGNFDQFALVAGELPPRTGDGVTLRLEAEDYDSGGEVTIYGTIIGNVDSGDRLRYENVVFEESYRELRVRFAKGSTTPASIQVRLDDVASAPIATMPIASTGAWDAYQTVSILLPATSGTHDVILDFVMSGASGVGNFDYFELASSSPP